MTIDLVALAAWIGTLTVIVTAVIKLAKPIKRRLDRDKDLKDALRDLYFEWIKLVSRSSTERKGVSDEDFDDFKKMYKTYTEKLDGDKNGKPLRWKTNVETLHAKGGAQAPEPEEVLRSVLAVDDSPSILRHLKHALQERYRFFGIADPKEVDGFLLKHTPDLFILDCEMPEMSGLELIPLIRDYPEHRLTPIIMLTGDKTKETWEKAIKLGASDYINKPVDTMKIQEVVALHIKQRSKT